MIDHHQTDSDIARLIQELTKRLNRDVLLGSQLGKLIHDSAAVCGFQFRPRFFGGLRAFVDTYLLSVVERDKTPGAPDDLYRVLTPTSNAPDAVPPTWTPASGDDATFWQHFSNPTKAATFGLNEAQELWLIKATSILPERWGELQRMTVADYFGMAKKYIVNLRDQNVHFPLEEIEKLGAESFFPKWYAMLRKSPDKEATKKWEIYRVHNVIDTLIQHLMATGMPESQARSYGAMLRTSQVSGLSQREQRVSVALSVTEKSPVTLDYLREIITKVTRELTVEQMRQLILPLGIVIDAISNSDSCKGIRK